MGGGGTQLLAELFKWVRTSVVSAATPVGAKLFQWGIVLGRKNTSGHHFMSGACNTVSCVMTWWILFSETESSTELAIAAH